MELDYRVQEKRNEIVELAKDVVINNIPRNVKENSNFSVYEISSKITDYFVRIDLFSLDAGSRSIFVGPGGMGGGTSKKAGNVLLDWKELFVICSDSALTLAGAVSIPLLIPLAALVVWNKFYSLTNIQITERTAAVIWTMWKNRDAKNCIENEKILDLINVELLNYNRPKMVQDELKTIIKDLEDMKCIKEIDKNMWQLIERVVIV